MVHRAILPFRLSKLLKAGL